MSENILYSYRILQPLNRRETDTTVSKDWIQNLYLLYSNYKKTTTTHKDRTSGKTEKSICLLQKHG